MRDMGETKEKGEDNIERILTSEKFYRLAICRPLLIILKEFFFTLQ